MNIFVDKVTIDGAHLVSFHFINCDIGQEMNIIQFLLWWDIMLVRWNLSE